jgi:peptidyl-prolyl cis-trans isomerase SurA
MFRANQVRFVPVLVGALLIPLTSAQETAESKEPRILDEIVAKVNNEIITLTDLNKAVDQLRIALQDEVKDPNDYNEAFDVRKREILRTLIQNKIMMQRAEELGITADIDVDVATYLEEMRKEAGIPSLDVLDQYFQQRGSSLAEYRGIIREQMINRSLMQQYVYSKITLLTPEVEAYYEENKARFTEPPQVELAEILFLTEGKDVAEVRRKAEECYRRLQNGDPFEELAKELSDGPTAAKGGYIGNFKKGSLNDMLERVVFELEPGSYSEIIESEFGFQIVEVINRLDSVVKPLQEVRPQIADALYQKKAEPEVKEFLKQLVEESYIYIKPKYADQYNVEGLI